MLEIWKNYLDILFFKALVCGAFIGIDKNLRTLNCEYKKARQLLLHYVILKKSFDYLYDIKYSVMLNHN